MRYDKRVLFGWRKTPLSLAGDAANLTTRTWAGDGGCGGGAGWILSISKLEAAEVVIVLTNREEVTLMYYTWHCQRLRVHVPGVLQLVRGWSLYYLWNVNNFLLHPLAKMMTENLTICAHWSSEEHPHNLNFSSFNFINTGRSPPTTSLTGQEPYKSLPPCSHELRRLGARNFVAY